MTTTAIDADHPRTEEEARAVAEFEASIPQAMKTTIAGLKLRDEIYRLCGFCQPTEWRIETVRDQLMAKTFAKRDKSLIVDGNRHPLILPNGSPVPLIESWEEFAELRLWASMISPAEAERRAAIGRSMIEIGRWFRRFILIANRVALSLARFFRGGS